ncbi:MAG: alcohol dehydrogenase [Acidiphilium sp. 37-64-53]|uniref:aldo/keto reductase n=1 Tax=Acidiphilium TaxID=522 RepID=UPI000BD4A260|nr:MULTISPECIES: aldo/keto reductase [Acidiphilium]OYW02564.1 MAG: alcohol dehydrogenase [Acidiphilium sp. 37-64-53]OZB29853.1 MAG: alcohol dehydrogenase [Acidiphilium sp. 34-64-41]HQT84057.1 aldo/keto reductase [Acidiphilium rubrum]
MNHKQLGTSGLSLPPIMFGGNVFGWTADEATSFALLDRLRDAGLTAIDTADMYSVWAPGHKGGESETVIGSWLARTGARSEMLIATKVGMMTGADGRKLSKPTILAAADASLQRLKTDVIDLYQAHADETDTPLEETLEAFAMLIEQGKVRAIGASNYTAPRLKEALETSERLGLPRYQSLQPHYNLVERPGYEAELEPLCVAEHLGVINYFALAAGFLTGKYRNEGDFAASPRGAGVKKYLNPQGKQILAALDDIAARHHATPGQVAIAWLIARPSITAPIASATSTAQLDDLIKAASLTLSPADIDSLNHASA